MSQTRWRCVLFAPPEKRASLFDPFGDQRFPEAVVSALAATIAPSGWILGHMALRLQQDGHNCGLWCKYEKMQ